MACRCIVDVRERREDCRNQYEGYLGTSAQEKIIVIGATLGGWRPPVPQQYLPGCIVVMLCVNLGLVHYGNRACPFASNEPASWEEDRASPEPCQRTWVIIRHSLALGACPRLTFLGISVGFDHIMSVIASKKEWLRAR